MITIDLETVPGHASWVLDDIEANIKHPGNIKKQETIDKWNEESKPEAVSEAWRKTGLNATKGELLCFGYAFDDNEPLALIRTLEQPESDLLNAINEVMAENVRNNELALWVGHNITGFDLRFLFLRFVVNGIQPMFHIPYFAKPWEDTVFDTMVEWKGVGQSPVSGSLDAVSKALGYQGKGDIDGSKIYDYAIQGKYDEIALYCRDDVVKARNIYNRLTFRG